jgi:hypothetical protein
MAWLSGYENRKILPITATTPGPLGGLTITIPISGDSQLSELNPNTNYGSSTTLILNTDQLENNIYRLIASADVSSYTHGSVNITSATLNYYWSSTFYGTPAGMSTTAYKCTHSFNESQVTWNSYSTGNSWTTPGGDFVTSNPSGGTVTLPSTPTNWVSWPITDIVKDAIDNNNSIVETIMKWDTEVNGNGEIPVFNSREASDHTPYIQINYGVPPSVPSDYKVTIDIYKDSPTVQTGTWTVNSKTYHNRVPFTVNVFSAISSSYAKEILIDTKSLVDGGFFASSSSSNAKSVEFADGSGNCLYYWAQSALGTPDSFNTNNTRYFVGFNSFSANTTYTLYYYFDSAITSASSFHSPSQVFSFFDDFDQNEANISAFLSYYTKWEQDTTSVPVVSTSSSVLTLAGSTNSNWNGIATKLSGGFTIQNWRLWSRIVTTPGTGTLFGMMDVDGVTAQEDGIVFHYTDATHTYDSYLDGSQTQYNLPIDTTPYVIYLNEYAGTWKMAANKDQADGITPDKSLMNAISPACSDVIMKLNIASFSTNSIQIDWLAVAPELAEPPKITFPDITYPRNGAIFLDGQNQSWPHDIEFTDAAGNQLYYYRDDLAELTKQPGRSTQVAVRVTSDLNSNQNIYCYYNNPSVTTDPAHMSGSNTFSDTNNYFTSFSSISDWTAEVGSWSTATVPLPVLTKGETSNALGNGGGRLWAREPSVLKWGTNDYRLIHTNSQWEYSQGAWPAGYQSYYTKTTSLGTPFPPTSRLNLLPDQTEYAPDYWPDQLYSFNGQAYIFTSGANGFNVVATSDFSSYTKNSNGPFFTAPWIRSKTGTDFQYLTSALSMQVAKVSSTYHIFVDGLADFANDGEQSTVNGYAAYFYTTVAPENWNPSTSFTYGGKLSIKPGTYMEDSSLIYDGSRYWYWYWVCPSSNPSIIYFTLDTNTQTFPTGTWSASSSLNITALPPEANTLQLTGPRLMQDGSDWWLHFSYQGAYNPSYPQTNWVPNYVASAKASSLAGPWTIQNTDTRYHTAGNGFEFETSYITTPSYSNFEVISEVQATSFGGILFRYDPTTQTGYTININTDGVNAYIKFYTVNASGPNTQIGSTYTVPYYPIPNYYPNYSMRFRVLAYGTSIKIYYSLWGNQWILVYDVTDSTYSSGKIGVSSINSSYFNNLRVKELVLPEPSLGMGTIEAGANALLLLLSDLF